MFNAILTAVLNVGRRALAWVGRNYYYLIAAVLVVAGAATFRACQIGRLVSQDAAIHPALPRKQVKALIAQAKKDSAVAGAASKIAHLYHRQADSALAVAKTLTAQANSIHAQTILLPPVARGPIAVVERQLRAYQRPDTTGQ